MAGPKARRGPALVVVPPPEPEPKPLPEPTASPQPRTESYPAAALAVAGATAGAGADVGGVLLEPLLEIWLAVPELALYATPAPGRIGTVCACAVAAPKERAIAPVTIMVFFM